MTQKNNYQLKRLETSDQFDSIVSIQADNLIDTVDAITQKQDGFLVLSLSRSELQQFHAIHSILLALDQERVIGYLILATRDSTKIHPLIDQMIEASFAFRITDKTITAPLFVVQVCVAKENRNQGIFYALYESMIESAKNQFDCILTHVRQANTRSLYAHQKMNFKILNPSEEGKVEDFLMCFNF